MKTSLASLRSWYERSRLASQQGAFRLLSGVEIPNDWAAYSTQQADQFEIVHRPIWDTETFVSNSTVSLNFFASAQATVDLGNEVFPLKNSYLIASIGIYFKSNLAQTQTTASDADIPSRFVDQQKIINTGWLNIFIGNKDYGPWPLMKLSSGCGMWGLLSGGGTPGFNNYSQIGVADPRAMFKLAIPLVLPMNTRVVMQMNWAAAITTTDAAPKITLILDGKEARPLQ